MRDIIFISLENWDGVWRRNQFLCHEWLQRFPEMRLLFVGRSKDFSHAVHSLSLKEVRRPLLERSANYNGLTVLNPVKLFPNSVAGGRALNLWMLRQQILIASRKMGLRAPLLWINDHCAEPLVGKLGERAVVYDITDDWTLLSATPESERERIRQADARLCQKADLVIVCSAALERSRRNLCRKLLRVPNGVDASHYKSCASRGRAPRGEPVFGYVGTLHGDRLDVDLVLGLARAKTEARVVLCGPDFLNASERKKLLSAPNIYLQKAVDYKDVPGVISGFDVCILPHRCTPFTESLNPIKLWEYLASGKPVAATPVAGFRERAHLCHLGSGVDGFVKACESALFEDPGHSLARIREAESNSWQCRSEQVLEAFRQEGWLGRPVPRPKTIQNKASRGAAGENAPAAIRNAPEGSNECDGQTNLCETPV